MKSWAVRILVVFLFLALDTNAFALPAVTEGEYGLKIVIFDVEQADAALFLTPDGESALIDMGKTKAHGKKIANYLLNQEENNIDSIDALSVLFCSHYDDDHIGGASVLNGKIEVLSAYDQGPSAKRKTGSRPSYGKYVTLIGDPNGNGKRDSGESHFVRHTAKPGDAWTLGGKKAVSIEVLSVAGDTKGTAHDLELSPAQGKIDENPGSIMQVITLKDFQYLSMGDATSSKWKKDKPDTEMAMLAAGALPEGAKIDVLKVGHHGSDTSSGPDFVKAVSPKVAVISSAPTGHKLPKLTSIKALEECGAKVLVTGSARNAQGKFNEAKAEYDDGYKPTELMDKVGTITILVAKDGSRYTLRCEYKPDLVITNSARDN